MIDVGLDHMNVFQLTRGCERRLDRSAEIDANHLARAPTRGQLRMPAFAATAFKHDLVFEKLRLHRPNPTEKLFRVAFICLREVSPLPAKVRGRGGFVFFDLIETGKAGNPARNWEA